MNMKSKKGTKDKANKNYILFIKNILTKGIKGCIIK